MFGYLHTPRKRESQEIQSGNERRSERVAQHTRKWKVDAVHIRIRVRVSSNDPDHVLAAKLDKDVLQRHSVKVYSVVLVTYAAQEAAWSASKGLRL